MPTCEHQYKESKSAKGKCSVCGHSLKKELESMKCTKCGDVIHAKCNHPGAKTVPAGPPPPPPDASKSKSKSKTESSKNQPNAAEAAMIEEQIAILIPKLNLPEAIVKAWPLSKKLELVQMNAKLIAESRQATSSLGAKLQNVTHCVNMLKVDISVELMTQLLVILRTCTVDWLQNFLEMNGLTPIINKLKALSSPTEKTDEQIQMEDLCLSAVKAIMNNSVGMRYFATAKDAVKILAMCLSSKTISDKQRINVVSMLTVLSMCSDLGIPNPHQIVMSAMNTLKHYTREKRRFASLVSWIKTTKSLALKSSYLAFVNTLINEAPDLDLRISIRNEFLSLGLSDLLKELKNDPAIEAYPDIMTQIDLFDELGSLDDTDLLARFQDLKTELNVDVTSIDGCFSGLKEMATRTHLDEVLLSVLQNILAILASPDVPIEKLLIVDRVSRQISLREQHKLEHPDDVFNVGVEGNVVDFNRLLESVEDKTVEVKLKQELNLATEAKAIAQKKLTALTAQIEEKNRSSQQSDAKGLECAENASDVQQTPCDSSPLCAPAPLPNMPPPPPPPPPGLGALGIQEHPEYNKAVELLEKPSRKLKGFFWRKVQTDIRGTIFYKFENLDEILKEMPYKLLEKSFPAKEAVAMAKKGKDEKVTFIPSNNSKNTLILLRNFAGMTMKDIVAALQRCDGKLFTKDMLRTLKKAVATEDQMNAIRAFLTKPCNTREMLGEAENFALELAEVHLLEEKIKAFETKLSFQEQLKDLSTLVSTIDKAYAEILESKGLVQLFEYILMFGSFVNSGTARCVIDGFKLDTLERILNFKTDDNTQTMIDLIIQSVRTKNPELLKFPDEIPHVMEVSEKILDYVDDHVGILIRTVEDIKDTVKRLSSSDMPDKEPFISIMTEFLSHANEETDNLKKCNEVMKKKYQSVLIYFGEDIIEPGNCLAPKEFFKLMNNFVSGWEKAVKEANNAEAQANRKAELERRKAAEVKATMELNQTDVIDDRMGGVVSGTTFKSRRRRVAKS